MKFLKDLWEDKLCFWIFVFDIVALLILLFVCIFFNKEVQFLWKKQHERVIIFILNVIVVLSFQVYFYIARIKKLKVEKEEQKGEEEKVELKKNYYNFFGSDSYIAKYINDSSLEDKAGIENDVENEKLHRKEIIEKRLVDNKNNFIQSCFWLLGSFMLTYTVLFILSVIKAGYDDDNNHKLYGATPLNATIIEYDFKSKYFLDTLKMQFQPSLFNYIEDGVVHNLTDYALQEDTTLYKYYHSNSFIDSIKKLPLYKKNIEFKPAFLKSNTNIFIKELAEKKMIFEKIQVCRLNETVSSPHNNNKKNIASFTMVNMYQKDLHWFTKLYNCSETLVFNISNFFILVLFILLSFDTDSFKNKFPRQWDKTMSVLLFALLSVIELCLAILLNNNSYIVGNFVFKSFSTLVSVIFLSALAGRLNIYYLYNTQRNDSKKYNMLFLISFFFIYVYAASQIFYPFAKPIIKEFDNFEIWLFILSFLGKCGLFLVLLFFTDNKTIDMFFIFEINVIKSVPKNTGLEDFYYLMRFENKDENDYNKKEEEIDNRLKANT